MNKFRAQQTQAQAKRESQRDTKPIAKNPTPNKPVSRPNPFVPQRLSTPKSLMTPTNLRPSNINRAKVPVPSYRGIQAANRLAAEQIDKTEERDVIDRFP